MRRSLAALVLSLLLPFPALAAQVTVKPGETLSEIADRHGVSLSRLMQLNGISKADHVEVGQVLKLPANARTSSGNLPRPTGSVRVQEGDTLSGIAARQGMSLSQLMALNGISTADHVEVGQTLKVTGTLPAPAPSYRRDASFHVVKPGESLSEIADGYGLAMSRLVAINQLQDPDHVEIGMRLKLQGPAATSTPKASPTPRPAAASLPPQRPTPAPRAALPPAASVTQAARAAAAAAQPRSELLASRVATPAAETTPPVATIRAAVPAAQATPPTETPRPSEGAISTATAVSSAASSGVVSSAVVTRPARPASTSTLAMAPRAATPTVNTALATAPSSAAASSAAASAAAAGSWRRYGPLQVDWSGWQPMGGSLVAPVMNAKGDTLYLAINCGARKLNATSVAGDWRTWDNPQADFEQRLVNDLCRSRAS
ncbi:MAG: LysM peptidoglycan-binding domain-containing protein [Cyanobium sp.]